MKFKFILLSGFIGLTFSANGQSMDWLCHPGEYSEVSYLGQDLFKVRNNHGKWGIIQADGKKSIDIRYDSITQFVENKALLLDREGKRLLGIINSKGELVKDLSAAEFYVTKYPNYKEGRLAFTNKNGLSGYLNERGEIAIEPNYYLAAPFQDGIAAVQYQGGDYGLINKGGKSAIVSNTEYRFISSPVDGRVFIINGSRRGADAFRLCKIDGAKLKTEKTFEDGMYIELSDDFTSVECQKGNRYYIDNQWRISGSNSNNNLPQISEGTQYFHIEKSKILGKSNVEGGLRITYLGNPIVNNIFPDVSTFDDYAIVHSKDGKVGVLKLNKSAAIDIKAPNTPIVFYHNQPIEVLLDVDLKAVNPDKLHWYRNDTGYLTHSSLEYNNGKYQLRMPYYKPNSNTGENLLEDVDIAFTYDGLDWMHHTLKLESVHRNTDRFDISISGNNTADANGRCNLTINVKSLNGQAKGKITIPGIKSEQINGESFKISIIVNVPDNAIKNYSFTLKIEEEGCPVYSTTISKIIQGRKTEKREKKKIDLEEL